MTAHNIGKGDSKLEIDRQGKSSTSATVLLISFGLLDKQISLLTFNELINGYFSALMDTGIRPSVIYD
jgi:hypothetical protein